MFGGMGSRSRSQGFHLSHMSWRKHVKFGEQKSVFVCVYVSFHFSFYFQVYLFMFAQRNRRIPLFVYLFVWLFVVFLQILLFFSFMSWNNTIHIYIWYGDRAFSLLQHLNKHIQYTYEDISIRTIFPHISICLYVYCNETLSFSDKSAFFILFALLHKSFERKRYAFW